MSRSKIAALCPLSRKDSAMRPLPAKNSMQCRSCTSVKPCWVERNCRSETSTSGKPILTIVFTPCTWALFFRRGLAASGRDSNNFCSSCNRPHQRIPSQPIPYYPQVSNAQHETDGLHIFLRGMALRAASAHACRKQNGALCVLDAHPRMVRTGIAIFIVFRTLQDSQQVHHIYLYSEMLIAHSHMPAFSGLKYRPSL